MLCCVRACLLGGRLNSTSAAFVGVSSLMPSSPVAITHPQTTVVRNDIRPPAAAAAPAAASLRSASRRVHKQLQSRVTWKCVALLLVCLTAFLLALLSYLAGKSYLSVNVTSHSCL